MAIARHSSLQVLKLCDLAEIDEAQRSREKIECEVFKSGFHTPPSHSTSSIPFPSLSLRRLELLQCPCPSITELDLGIDREQKEVRTYLNLLRMY